MTRTVLLDTNIYDCLHVDVDARRILARMVADDRVEIIVTPKIRDELEPGPFGGVPDWFPTREVIESVAVLDHWHLGEAALGEGEVFTAHRGASKKVADAIVADSADTLADILVSEDNRLRTRFSEVGETCVAMNFAEFVAWLEVEA